MCEEITRLLMTWEKDPNIGAVLIDGAGERAFCAGGDVILLHDSGKADDSRAEEFWRIEYALNELIHRYSKPYILRVMRRCLPCLKRGLVTSQMWVGLIFCQGSVWILGNGLA